jgi:mannosylglycerate hydrolase
MPKKKIHVLSNTHWDREHRHGFQETRIMLVEMIEELISIFDSDPDFKSFTFDGQSVPLEDILEINPQLEGRLKQLVSDGRILIGPWYTLPDMTPARPEALIRNLLMGDKVCARFGRKMMAGYSIFSFGQIAQLPQLYAGFCIDSLICYKGAPKHVHKHPEFIWKAPNGDKVLCSILGKHSRMNFYVSFTVPVILGGDIFSDDWQAVYTNHRRLVHCVNRNLCHLNAKEMEPDIRIREELIKGAVDEILDTVKSSAAKKNFLAFDGIDFSTPLKELPAALKLANELNNGGVMLVHSTLQDYFAEFRAEVDVGSLDEHTGEMRYGPIQDIHSETISGNMPLKQQMFRVESEIIDYAEPLSVFASTLGVRFPRGVLEFAWKDLLKSQAHDSFHGAGAAKIKPDTIYRLEQVHEIAESVTRRAVESIVNGLDTANYADDDILLCVFNPCPFPRKCAVIRVCLDLPEAEFVRDYQIVDVDGNRLKLFKYGSRHENIAAVNPENRPKPVRLCRDDVDVEVNDIPALGYKTLVLKRTKGSASDNPNPFGEPVFSAGTIARKTNVLDNGRLRVTIRPDATVDVYDYDTGRDFTGLNALSDSGEAGNVWVHNPPQHNRIISSVGAAGEISLLENSFLSATSQVRFDLNLPESLDQLRTGRSSAAVRQELICLITLQKDSKVLRFSLAFDNAVQDHKLSVSFPTGIETEYSFSDSSFELKKRPVEYLTDHNGYAGPELRTHPMQKFIDVSDGKGGVSLFSKGLHEFQTCNDDGALIELTLLRAATQTFPLHTGVDVKFAEEPSQCLEHVECEYALYFHPGDLTEACVPRVSEEYGLECVVAQSGLGSGGSLPAEASFIELSHPMTQLNCVKLAEKSDDIIIRLTNPTGEIIKEQLTVFGQVEKAMLCRLNEDIQEELKVSDGSRINLELKPYTIYTLMLSVVQMA